MKFLLIFFSYLLSFTYSFYFEMGSLEKRCFYDEYYNEILIVMRYELLNNFSFLPEDNKTKFVVIMKNEDTDQEIESFRGKKIKEKFSYHLDQPMKVEFCLYTDYDFFPNSNSSFDVLKVNFKLDTNEDEIDEENTVKNKDVENIDTNIRFINKTTTEIEAMIKSGDAAEKRFSEFQSQNSNWLVNITIAQIIFIIIIGIWQFFSLRSYYLVNSKYN